MSYKRQDETSFALGAFATSELIKYRPSALRKIYLHKDLKMSADIEEILKNARNLGVSIEQNNHKIENISKKEPKVRSDSTRSNTC